MLSRIVAAAIVATAPAIVAAQEPAAKGRGIPEEMRGAFRGDDGKSSGRP
jgi:hypothetical protein